MQTFSYTVVFLCETIRIHLIQGLFSCDPKLHWSFLNHAGTYWPSAGVNKKVNDTYNTQPLHKLFIPVAKSGLAWSGRSNQTIKAITVSK